MRKLLIGWAIFLTLGLTFSVDLTRYFSQTEIKLINSYLETFHNKLTKLPQEKRCKKYSNILTKVQKIEKEKLPQKILILLEYIQEQVSNWSKEYNIIPSTANKNQHREKESQQVQKESKQSTTTPEKIKINSSLLRKDSILVPISWTAYLIYWLNLKPIYWDVLVKSLLFKNVYGNEADILIKKAYLISLTGAILAKNNFTNWYIYFELKKPIRLIKDIYTPFYIAVSLNEPTWNTTNKPIKLQLAKNYNTLKTTIISADNGNEIWNWYWHDFASHSYLIRNSKLLLKNYYTRRNLRNWFRQIFSLNINSSWDKSLLKSIRLNTYLYKTSFNTWGFLLKINNLKYPNAKFIFSWENYVWNWILQIVFPQDGYDIQTWLKLDIYATFKSTKDHGKALISLKDISEFTWIVNQNYTWNYSILWSDNTFRNWTYNYFTDSYLDFTKVYEWYLKNN